MAKQTPLQGRGASRPRVPTRSVGTRRGGSRLPLRSFCSLVLIAGGCCAHLPAFERSQADEITALHNVREQQGAYTLAPGPDVEGVVLVQQGQWPPDVIRTFHQVAWLDVASIRLRWAELEPRDQQFDWTGFDRVLGEVKKYNAAHPGSRRTLHIRVMGGVHSPRWFQRAGVKYYDTTHRTGRSPTAPLHIPVPYDNPEFLNQLREVYRAMYKRYRDEPLVTVYHGTWSAGPWDEIFHPQRPAPLPPDYSPEKFVRGMIEQLDVLIDEFCLRGKVAELPYSGKYPPKTTINITGPLTDRIVERLGRRSPFLYIQTNGWGMTNRGLQTVSWGHERDVKDAFGSVNLALQALGTNAGGGWFPQGDWIPLVELARRYEVAYVELYPPDFQPLDTEHHIVEAFTHGEESSPPTAGAPPGFLGFRPWLKKRGRVLFVREGTVARTYRAGAQPRRVADVSVTAAAPEDTSITTRVRTRRSGGDWSDWRSTPQLADLPAADEAQIQLTLHTDDGYRTPRVTEIRLLWQ